MKRRGKKNPNWYRVETYGEVAGNRSGHRRQDWVERRSKEGDGKDKGNQIEPLGQVRGVYIGPPNGPDRRARFPPPARIAPCVGLRSRSTVLNPEQ